MTVPDFLEHDRDVGFLSAFKTPAKARYFLDITERYQIDLLPIAYSFAREQGIPLMIVGGGTNCLFAFDIYKGIIIRNRYTGYSEPYENEGKKRILVHSGEMSTSFAISLYQYYGISTLVPWVGLPGTMGGACIGNAGCFGLEMMDMLIEVRLLDLETGTMIHYQCDDMHYAYRESILKNNERYFVIDMTLDIAPREGNIYETYTPGDLQALRKLKQPPGFSCGSFFKNPKISDSHNSIGEIANLTGERHHIETLSAGKLIDQAGLKDMRIGGVRVSDRHGNFVINDQKGTWQDILELRDTIKDKIQKKYGIDLHEEVRIITNSSL